MDFDQDVFGGRDRVGDVGKVDAVGDRAIAVENKCSHG